MKLHLIRMLRGLLICSGLTVGVVGFVLLTKSYPLVITGLLFLVLSYVIGSILNE